MLVLVLALLLNTAVHHRKAISSAVIVTAAGVLGYLVCLGLKPLVAEPRPCATIAGATVAVCPQNDSWSWPSSHSAFGGAAMVALIVLAPRLWALWGTLALLLGASRIFLGVHYLHDIFSGLALGAGLTLAGFLFGDALWNRLRRRRFRVSSG